MAKTEKIGLDAVPGKPKKKYKQKKTWSRQPKPAVNTELLADLLIAVAKKL